MTDTLEIIRRHHEQIVDEERLRRRSEQELRRLLPLLYRQAGHWREAGGAETGCALVPLIEDYERRLRGEAAEGPSQRKAAAPQPAREATSEVAPVESGSTAGEQGSDRSRGPSTGPSTGSGGASGRGRRRSEE